MRSSSYTAAAALHRAYHQKRCKPRNVSSRIGPRFRDRHTSTTEMRQFLYMAAARDRAYRYKRCKSQKGQPSIAPRFRYNVTPICGIQMRQLLYTGLARDRAYRHKRCKPRKGLVSKAPRFRYNLAPLSGSQMLHIFYTEAARDRAYRHQHCCKPRKGSVRTAPRFRYEPLSGTQIRLLYVKPGQEDCIRCRLRTVYLSESPRYHALSYVWGHPRHCQLIKVNGTPFLVTQNLYQALKDIRDMPPNNLLSPPFALWVDATCINQMDNDEKSRQIPRMGAIYSAADRVIISMPPEDAGDSYERDIHKELFSQTSIRWASTQPANAVPENHHRLDRKGASDELKYILREFINHQWFARIWTTQEAVLARKSPVFVHVFDGSISLATLSFINGLYKGMEVGPIAHLGNLMALRRWVQTPYSSAKVWAGDAGSMLMTLFCYTHHKVSSMWHDRVYGLYGLLQIVNVRFPNLELPSVDYNRPHREIFFDLTKLIIQHTGNSSVLSSARVRDRVRGMPTWVSTFSNCGEPWRQEPSDDDDPESRPKISDDGQVLTITAAVTDYVKVILPPDGNIYVTEEERWAIFERRIDEIEKSLIGPIAARRAVEPEELLLSLIAPGERHVFAQWREAGDGRSSWYNNPALTLVDIFLTTGSIFVTQQGFIGKCPEPYQVGDAVCLMLQGGPKLLRQKVQINRYEVIGDINTWDVGIENRSGVSFGRIELV